MKESNILKTMKGLRWVGVFIGMCLGLTLSFLTDSLLDIPLLHDTSHEIVIPQFATTQSHSATQSDQTAQIESPSLKRQRLMQALVNMNVDQVIELLDQVRGTTVDRQYQLVQETALRELARRNPHEALRQTWRTKRHRWSALIVQVFGEWSLQNLEEALTVANTLDGPLRHNAIVSALSHRDDLSDDQRIALSESHGFELLGNLVISNERAIGLSHQPHVALQSLLDDEVDDGSQISLIADLVSNWVFQEGVDAYVPMFRALHDKHANSPDILYAITRQVVHSNPREAWAQCLNLPRDLRSPFYQPILTAWVALDSVDALAVIGETNDPRTQSEQFRVLFDVWARLKPRDLLTNIQLVPEMHKRNSIAWAIGELARQDPPTEAVEQLRRMASQAVNIDYASELLVATWACTDPIEAVRWILEENRDIDVKRENLLLIALPHLAVTDPARAIEVLRNPIVRDDEETDAHDPSQLGVEVISALASNGRFDAAMNVLKVVDSSRKFDAMRTLGLSLIEFDQHDKAIELALDLPESSRLTYFESLAYYWVFLNAGQLVDSMPRLPSDNVRRSMASAVWSNREYVHLTDEQYAYVEALLQTDEAQ